MEFHIVEINFYDLEVNVGVPSKAVKRRAGARATIGDGPPAGPARLSCPDGSRPPGRPPCGRAAGAADYPAPVDDFACDSPTAAALARRLSEPAGTRPPWCGPAGGDFGDVVIAGPGEPLDFVAGSLVLAVGESHAKSSTGAG
jgi:hypothetical protein